MQCREQRVDDLFKVVIEFGLSFLASGSDSALNQRLIT